MKGLKLGLFIVGIIYGILAVATAICGLYTLSVSLLVVALIMLLWTDRLSIKDKLGVK